MSILLPLSIKCKLISIISVNNNIYTVQLFINGLSTNGGTGSFDGTNVSPDMWFSNRSQGFSWRINKIYTQTAQSIKCDIEDVDFYNRLIDDGSTGSFDPIVSNEGYIFSLDLNGLPILFPFDASNKYDIRWVTDITNRFRSRNVYSNYITILQIGHSLSPGDFININNGIYVKSTSTNNINNTIGLVVSKGINDVQNGINNDYFSFKPFGTLIKKSNLPSNVNSTSFPIGTVFYLDTSGNLTTTQPINNIYPVYIKINNNDDLILLNNSFNTNSSNTSSTTVSSQSATIDFYYNNGNLTKTIFTNGLTVLTNNITSNNKSITIPTNLTNYPKSIFIWGKKYNGSIFTWKVTQCLTNNGLSFTYNQTDKSINLSAYSYSNLLGLLGIINPPNNQEILVATIILNF